MTPLGKGPLWLRPPAPKYIESWVDQLPRNQINETENKQQRRLTCAGLDWPMRRHPDMKQKKEKTAAPRAATDSQREWTASTFCQYCR